MKKKVLDWICVQTSCKCKMKQLFVFELVWSISEWNISCVDLVTLCIFAKQLFFQPQKKCQFSSSNTFRLVWLIKRWYEESFGGFLFALVDLILDQLGSYSSPAKTTHLCLFFCDASAKNFVDMCVVLFPQSTHSVGCAFSMSIALLKSNKESFHPHAHPNNGFAKSLILTTYSCDTTSIAGNQELRRFPELQFWKLHQKDFISFVYHFTSS